jgi:hypothetical protein
MLDVVKEKSRSMSRTLISKYGSRLAQGKRKCQDARNEREKQVRKSFKNF